MIELKKITWDNYEAVLNLQLLEGQKGYVTPNYKSLVQAYIGITNDDEPPLPFAICKECGEVIGFAMMEREEMGEDDYFRQQFGDKAIYNLYRFMIDKNHQGKGYGRQAMVKILEFLRQAPRGAADSISICYKPSNETARKLYTSLGFVETGHMNGEDMLARLALQ
ncbi:MAG: GNAT family N-acetyltransferase [Defluviitaleaceae bacterium]|nr:GNAT family N-acetyltransferase [Defluviitaleaceae bacterium]